MALLQITEPGQSVDPHQRKIAAGIDLGFVRFSTGLEDFDDLKNDFDQALSSL